MRTLFTLTILLLTMSSTLAGQEPAPAEGTKIVTFRFAPGEDKFTLLGNEAELQRLCTLIDECRNEISSGRLPLYVDGYCASLTTERENLRIARLRANRVKSELITRKGLQEAHFITAIHAAPWQSHKDMVVVTLRIPAKTEGIQTDAPHEQLPSKEKADIDQHLQASEQESLQASEQELLQASQQVSKPEQASQQVQPQASEQMQQQPSQPLTLEKEQPESSSQPPYCLALRTNVLYDVMLLPTLGIEWRINRNVGIKLDGSLSWWGGEHGKVQKMWLLNPEVRWYLLADRRFYVGASGSYSRYNIYKYMLGKMLTDDTGYQGKLWNAGLTVGYQLHLSRSFSVDFNLGLGYSRSEYDSFRLMDRVRVYKDRDRVKNFWGPTQAGIGLIWTIGGGK